MISRDEIVRVIRAKGPVLPVQIAKEANTTILFASAMLSELVASKILKVSSVKVGGSPVYYLPEHSSMLQNFSKNLNQKEREAYELLKGSKVLKESDQEPAIKVALRNIKDFAWPLRVTINETQEIFWRWYLTSNEEAGEEIKKLLGITEEKEQPTPSLPSSDRQNDSGLNQSAETIVQKTVQKKVRAKRQKPLEIQKELAQSQASDPAQTLDQAQASDLQPQHGELAAPAAQTSVAAEPLAFERAAEKKDEPAPDTELSIQMLDYFAKNSISVINKEIIKKSEADFIIEIPSVVGTLKYYCKAKAKQKIGEGDLSAAYVQGELRKLPVLFLSSGAPTKKAAEMLQKEFRNMVFKKI